MEYAFKAYYALEFLTRSSVGTMVYFPFEFRFPGTNGHIENGRTKLRLNYSLATGLSDGRVRKIHHDMNMEVATAQMKEPDPKPAPTKGKFSFSP